jgi:hypothetical protein
MQYLGPNPTSLIINAQLINNIFTKELKMYEKMLYIYITLPRVSTQLVILREINSEYYFKALNNLQSCKILIKYFAIVNPLTPELNPSAQRSLPRFFTGDFNF